MEQALLSNWTAEKLLKGIDAVAPCSPRKNIITRSTEEKSHISHHITGSKTPVFEARYEKCGGLGTRLGTCLASKHRQFVFVCRSDCCQTVARNSNIF